MDNNNVNDRLEKFKSKVEEFKTFKLDYNNTNEFYSGLDNSVVQINGIINSFFEEYQSIKDAYKKILADNESLKEIVEGTDNTQLVPVVLVHLKDQMNKLASKIIQWASVIEQLYDIGFKKYKSAHDFSKALDIQKDTLSNMREVFKEKDEMVKELFAFNKEWMLEHERNLLKTFKEEFSSITVKTVSEQPVAQPLKMPIIDPKPIIKTDGLDEKVDDEDSFNVNLPVSKHDDTELNDLMADLDIPEKPINKILEED